MDKPSYKLVFDGKIKEGEELRQVKSRMVSLFRTDAKAIDTLFKTPGTVIKRGLTRQQAIKYKQAIEKTGALCRIVKEKAPSEAPASPQKSSPGVKTQTQPILYHSRIPYPRKGLFVYIIWPIVQAKNVFETLYDLILERIWHELIGKRQYYSQTSELIAFLVCAVLALIFYYTRDYEDVIVLGVLALWCADYFFAKLTVFREKTYEEVTLRSHKDGQIHWKQVCHDGETHTVNVEPTDMLRISIARVALLRGAFQEFVGYVWQIFLTLSDGSDFLIGQEQSANRAVRVSMKLAGSLNIPVKFVASEGKSPLACDDSEPVLLKHKMFSSGAIISKESGEQVRLTSAWTMKNVWLLLKKIMSEAGFFLFFLIMYGILIRFGMLLNFFIAPYLGIPRGSLVLNISFSGILGLFKPEGDWMDLIELAIALGIMAYSGWKLSRRKTIAIDKDSVAFFIGRNEVAALKTGDVHSPVFIKEPEPLLVILDNNAAIEIEELQTEYEFRALKVEVEKGIAKFKGEQP